MFSYCDASHCPRYITWARIGATWLTLRCNPFSLRSLVDMLTRTDNRLRDCTNSWSTSSKQTGAKRSKHLKYLDSEHPIFCALRFLPSFSRKSKSCSFWLSGFKRFIQFPCECASSLQLGSEEVLLWFKKNQKIM